MHGQLPLSESVEIRGAREQKPNNKLGVSIPIGPLPSKHPLRADFREVGPLPLAKFGARRGRYENMKFSLI